MSGRFFLSDSTEMASNSFDTSRARRERPSFVRSASRRCPERIFDAPYSMEASIHAS
jgi:hypothetical protein